MQYTITSLPKEFMGPNLNAEWLNEFMKRKGYKTLTAETLADAWLEANGWQHPRLRRQEECVYIEELAYTPVVANNTDNETPESVLAVARMLAKGHTVQSIHKAIGKQAMLEAYQWLREEHKRRKNCLPVLRKFFAVCESVYGFKHEG